MPRGGLAGSAVEAIPPVRNWRASLAAAPHLALKAPIFCSADGSIAPCSVGTLRPRPSGGAPRRQRAVDGTGLLGDTSVRVARENSPATARGECAAERRIVGQPAERGREAFRVALGHDQARIPEHVRYLAAVRADTGHAAGHRLDQDSSELLLP